MTAKEMFEALNFEQTIENSFFANDSCFLVYTQHQEDRIVTVCFDTKHKFCSFKNTAYDGWRDVCWLYPKLIHAIDQQMRELGWTE